MATRKVGSADLMHLGREFVWYAVVEDAFRQVQLYDTRHGYNDLVWSPRRFV